MLCCVKYGLYWIYCEFLIRIILACTGFTISFTRLTVQSKEQGISWWCDFFVISSINADDDLDANYSDSGYEDVNDYYLEEEYYDEKYGILNVLEYVNSDSEEDEEQDDAINFPTLSEKFYVIFLKGE